MPSDSDIVPLDDYPTWDAGAARRCITPSREIWLYGYASPPRFHASTGVINDLYVDALVIRSVDGESALLLCIDICVIRKPLAEELLRKVSEVTGIARERILLNVSHTHSGPTLDQPDLDGRFPMSADERAWVVEYTQWMQKQAVDAAREAMAMREPARLSWAVGQTTIPCNRRKLDAEGRWSGMGPNREGMIDDRLPVLRVDDRDGKPLSIVFGCACHNVTLGDSNLLISADYAGFARTVIEDAFPACQAMFMTGCGADANTEPRSGIDQVAATRRHGETLGAEVIATLAQPLSRLQPPLHCALKTLQLPIAKADQEQLEKLAAGPEWQAFNAQLMLAALERGETLPEAYAAPISAWSFGDALTLIGLSGEVPSHYARELYRSLGSEQVWVAGYCHEIFGYLPTRQILREGGYETRGLLPPGIGYFTEEVEDEVLQAATALASEVRA